MEKHNRNQTESKPRRNREGCLVPGWFRFGFGLGSSSPWRRGRRGRTETKPKPNRNQNPSGRKGRRGRTETKPKPNRNQTATGCGVVLVAVWFRFGFGLFFLSSSHPFEGVKSNQTTTGPVLERSPRAKRAFRSCQARRDVHSLKILPAWRNICIRCASPIYRTTALTGRVGRSAVGRACTRLICARECNANSVAAHSPAHAD